MRVVIAANEGGRDDELRLMGGKVVDQGWRGGYTSEGRRSGIKSGQVCVVVELTVPR